MDALRLAGDNVELVSDLRAFDGAGDAGDATRQRHLRDAGLDVARTLIARWRDPAAGPPPDLWFTSRLARPRSQSHGGHAVRDCRSVARTQAPERVLSGPWAMGEAAVLDVLQQADLLFRPAAHDVTRLRRSDPARARIERLSPFLDPAPYRRAARKPGLRHARLGAASSTVPTDQPWRVLAATTRPGDKQASYEVLARTLALLPDLPWQLLMAGDGPARAQVDTTGVIVATP
jgi:hypothetical protein